MQYDKNRHEIYLEVGSLYIISLVQGHSKDVAQVIGRLKQESINSLLIETWEGLLSEGEQPGQYLVYKHAIRYVEPLQEEED